MTLASWAKGAATSLTAFLRGEISAAEYVGLTGERALDAQLQNYDSTQIRDRLEEHAVQPAVKVGYGNIQASFWFHCDPKIAAKIADVRSDGHQLVKPEGDTFIVWNVDQQRYDTWQKIYCGIDKESKTQICVVLNAADKKLSFNYGGTDFTNIKDMAFAATAVFGGVTPRVAAGGTLTEIAIERLAAYDPTLNFAELETTVSAHSRGAEAVPLATVALLQHGFNIAATDLYDPFGAEASYAAVERKMHIPARLFQQNVRSIKARKPGPLDRFKEASRTIGTLELCDAGGHLGKNYIEMLDKERVAAYRRTL